MPQRVSASSASTASEFEFTFRHAGAVLARFRGASREYLIGSDPACDLVLEIEGIAERHARLSLRDGVFLTDLDSGVGTYLDGQEIAGEREVRPLQSITFGYGDGELRLEEALPEREAPAVESAPANPEPAPVVEAAPVEERAVSPLEIPPDSETRASDRGPVEDPWTPPAHMVDDWSEALLLQATSPRKSEVFDAPPVSGDEVSVSWDRRPPEPPAAEDPKPPAVPKTEPVRAVAPAVSAAAPAPVPDSVPAPDLANEVARLKGELAIAKARAASLAAEASPALPAQGDQVGFLSLANSFLLKKMAASGETKKKIGELTAELKQRELALVEAWSRRQASEERCLELTKQLAQSANAAPVAPPRAPINPTVFWSAIAVVMIFIALLLHRIRDTEDRARAAEAVVALVKSVAPQLHREAQAALIAGDLAEARGKVERAFALDSEQGDYLLTLGRVHESRLDIPKAQAAYERAVVLKPSLGEAHESLELCRRISATRGGVGKVENLYGLHRLMLAQNRLAEALRMAQRISGDGEILRRTWELVLRAEGVRGDLRCNEDGTFDLDLALDSKSDLRVLRGLPLRSLNAARANLSDLSPLAGMPLRQLDVSATLVRDLSVLKGMPLEVLNVSNTSVTNLAHLRGLPLRELRADYTAVTDLAALTGLPLQTLSLMSTRVDSVSALSGMPLRQLNLAHTSVKDLGVLKHAPIETLNVEGTLVADITPLASAPLVSLNLSGTAVADLEPLRGSSLRELRLVGCKNLQKLEPLSTCTELERLVLPHRGLDVAPLQKLTRLRFLSYESDEATAAGEVQPAVAASSPVGKKIR